MVKKAALALLCLGVAAFWFGSLKNQTSDTPTKLASSPYFEDSQVIVLERVLKNPHLPEHEKVLGSTRYLRSAYLALASDLRGKTWLSQEERQKLREILVTALKWKKNQNREFIAKSFQAILILSTQPEVVAQGLSHDKEETLREIYRVLNEEMPQYSAELKSPVQNNTLAMIISSVDLNSKNPNKKNNQEYL